MRGVKRKGRSALAVLGWLSRRDLSGYSLRVLFGKPESVYWSESYGQIYPALRWLLEHSLIELIEPDSNKGGKSSKLYRVTEAGKDELSKWLRKPAGMMSLRDEIALRVSFGEHCNPAVTQGMLEAELERVRAQLSKVGEGDLFDEDVFEEMGSRWSIRYLEMREEWALDCLEKLEQMA